MHNCRLKYKYQLLLLCNVMLQYLELSCQSVMIDTSLEASLQKEWMAKNCNSHQKKFIEFLSFLSYIISDNILYHFQKVFKTFGCNINT